VSAVHLREKSTSESDNTLRRFEWLLPTLLAALAATHFAPLATPATLLLLCYLPGRFVVAGFGLGANWDAAGRLMLALATSLAITPVVLNPIWHFTNAAWPLLGCVWLLLTVACWLSRALGKAPTAPNELRLFGQTRTKVIFAVIAALVAFAVIGTYWPTELRGYPVPALIHDFIKHHALLFSLEQLPLPLGNPFFADDAAGPVYYYHFFYLIPATVRALSPGVSIELAFGLQAALVGICTAGMFYLIVKRFTGGDGPATLAALLATAIGGLDIIPVAIMRMRVITLDAWADHPVRIHNFLNQMIWSPQNVQGVLITLVAVYVLSIRGWWKGWLILGPVLAAALVGSSVWVALGVMPGLVLLVVAEIAGQHRQPRRAFTRLAGSLAVALLMLAVAWPSLQGYAEMSRRQEKGLTVEWPYQSHALLGRLAPPGALANLLDLPWVLLLELGPLLILPLLAPRRHWRRAWQDPGLRLLLLSAIVALLGFMNVRSDFKHNDFGQKIMMVTMAAGAVLAAGVLAPQARRPTLFNPLGWTLHGQSPQRRQLRLASFVGLILLLGLPVAIYEAPLTAVRRYIMEDSPLRIIAHPIALRSAEEAAAGRFLRYGLPAEAVIQAHCGTTRLVTAQIARKQIGVTALEQDTMVFFPADAGAHQNALDAVAEVLEQPVAAARCHETLHAHGITHVFVGSVERELWQGLDKFADERFFECVFHEGPSAVYALR
ncbi:MAG: hypothetical protein KKB50_08325, partial [Planctomycetes bacterium]|nr:hypothetical protein [Planctomycetota bacterium]